MYSGKLGVTSSDFHDGSEVVPALPKPEADWMAVFGRHVSKAYLASQATMAASPIEMLSSASSRAASASERDCADARESAIWFQWPGGVYVPPPSDQNLAICVW